MSNHDKPKWQKKLRRLLKSDDEKDREKLQEVLDKLRGKAQDLSDQLDQETDPDERTRLTEKLALVEKHLIKGERKLRSSEPVNKSENDE